LYYKAKNHRIRQCQLIWIPNYGFITKSGGRRHNDHR